MFDDNKYLIRRKVFTFLASKFHVYDADGNVVLFSEQKAFKLKEDIRIYSDDSKSEERLLIMARNIIDFSAAYDVVDPVAGEKIGALRRKGFKSMFRDSWEFLDNDDNVIGKIQEDSMLLATIRRFVANIIPQKFTATIGEQIVAHFKQRFNPFVFKLDVSIVSGAREIVDPRLLLACGILLVAIEGRQNG
jgi:uncharacterized protein YxjI